MGISPPQGARLFTGDQHFRANASIKGRHTNAMKSPARLRPRGTAVRARAFVLLSLVLALGIPAVHDVAQAADNQRNASPEEQSDFHTLVPGVVLSGSEELAYVMRPGGGIEALDTSNGDARWTSDRADQPLFLVDETLWCLAESRAPGLLLIPLSSRSGATEAALHKPVVLPLPEGVTASIDQSAERQFTVAAEMRDGAPYLAWRYLEYYPSGTAPPVGRPPFARFENGGFSFVEGRFEAVASPPQADIDAHLPLSVRAYLTTNESTRVAWRTASVVAIAEQRYRPDRLVLKRWRSDTEEALPDRVLMEGRAVAMLRSCEGNFLMVAEAVRDKAAREPYRLNVYSLDSGNPIAMLPSRDSAGPFCLADGRLLGTSPPHRTREGAELVSRPRELLAMDLDSGRVVWRKAYRDALFRGPLPPLTGP